MFAKYLIPYSYFLSTRLKGSIQKISWFFVYFIPAIVIAYQVLALKSPSSIISIFLALILVNYVYENGYIENDIITTSTETKPNLRIPLEEINIIRPKIKKIFILRYIVIAIFFLLFIILNPIKEGIYLLITILLIQFIYLLYNSVRNILNLFLIIPLSYLRFYGFALPFLNHDGLLVFLVFTVFLYPIPKFLEFSGMPRFGLKLNQKLFSNIDLFRVFYYFILSLFIFLYSINNNIPEYLFLSFYYFAYRSGTFILSKLSRIRKNLVNGFPRK